MASGSTVLRVKRRIEENPQDALVLVCKRIKTDDDSEIAPSLFVFRGTVENQETTHVKKVSSKDFKLKSADKVNDILDKIRQERKDVAAQSRYEIVNLSRGLKDIENENNLHLVDLQMKEEEDDSINFAYDLYTAVKKDFDISLLDNLLSIEKIETDLVLGSYGDDGEASSAGEESDDSNDENNWRNDYPEEHSSIDEDDIVKAVENLDIENDLSSDCGEAELYDAPAALAADAARFGEPYARYKARVLAEGDPAGSSRVPLVHCTEMKEDDSVDGYKDDSEDGFYYGAEQDSEQFRQQYDYGDHSDSSEPD